MRGMKEKNVPLHKSTHFFPPSPPSSLIYSRNSRGNRARVSRTHSSRACVCHASSARTCVSLGRTRAGASSRRASHEARNDERAPFLSDRSRAFPAFTPSRRERGCRPPRLRRTPLFSSRFLTKTKSRGEICLPFAAPRLHSGRTRGEQNEQRGLCSR